MSQSGLSRPDEWSEIRDIDSCADLSSCVLNDTFFACQSAQAFELRLDSFELAAVGR
jgi:hypothetical protein